MPLLRPSEEMPTWKANPAILRVLTCAVMLHLHGFITDAERLKVQARIEKWCRKHHVKIGKSKRA